MKKIKIILIIVGVITIAVLSIYKFNNNSNVNVKVSPQTSLYDTVYKINSQEVKLENGISTIEDTSPSTLKTTTKYFGNDLKGDFDKDGTEDVVFILTQNTGGAGTFYYITALLNKNTGKVGVDGFLLGDRISPKSISLGKNNTIVVNYYNRKSGESFDVIPSVARTVVLKIDTRIDPTAGKLIAQFGEVVQNFEGEANPAVMNLGMKTWVWTKTVYSDDKVITPKTSDKFTLILKSDKTFSATTDCNGIGGEYTVSGNKISFTRMMSTLMFCEGSQESDFSKMLSETQDFLFTSKGELVFGLKMDSGSMFFK